MTPPLPLLNAERLLVTRDGRHAVVPSVNGHFEVFDLSDLSGTGTGAQSREALLAYGSVLTSQKIHAGGVTNLTSDEWLASWKAYRKAHPEGLRRAPACLQEEYYGQLALQGRGHCGRGETAAWAAVAWHFGRVVGEKPDDAESWYAAGSANQALQRWDEAAACFSKTVELCPTDAVAYSRLGAVLHSKPDLPAAIAAYRKAITLDPKDATTHYNFGLALSKQNDPEWSHRRVSRSH